MRRALVLPASTEGLQRAGKCSSVADAPRPQRTHGVSPRLPGEEMSENKTHDKQEILGAAAWKAIAQKDHGGSSISRYVDELERELAEARKQIDTMLRVDCEQANELLRAMGGDPGYSLLDNAKRLRTLTLSARGDIVMEEINFLRSLIALHGVTAKMANCIEVRMEALKKSQYVNCMSPKDEK